MPAEELGSRMTTTRRARLARQAAGRLRVPGGSGGAGPDLGCGGDPRGRPEAARRAWELKGDALRHRNLRQPDRRFQCGNCGEVVDLCGYHAQHYRSRVGHIDWRWLAGCPRSAAPPFDPNDPPGVLPVPPLPTDTAPFHAVASRHQGEHGGARRQSSDRDELQSAELYRQRAPRPNERPIGSPANILRARIVARLMREWRVDLLLVMETGFRRPSVRRCSRSIVLGAKNTCRLKVRQPTNTRRRPPSYHSGPKPLGAPRDAAAPADRAIYP